MSQESKQKKVLVILGSPNKRGNSAILAEHIGKGAESQGATVETVFLHGLEIASCQACLACNQPDAEGCAIDDDMQPIYEKLKQAGAWVIASPVYWANVSAQTKIFMDRLYALEPQGLENVFLNKQIAIAMADMGKDPYVSGCHYPLESIKYSFEFLGAKIVGMVYGSAFMPGEIESNDALLKKAEKVGKKLLPNRLQQ
ncbi:MAG: flavodoxin family protein [Deltaproteobacteria bacterium]|nr:flavodoxin family protein [Deltaproteobacteria bacterium]